MFRSLAIAPVALLTYVVALATIATLRRLAAHPAGGVVCQCRPEAGGTITRHFRGDASSHVCADAIEVPATADAPASGKF